MLKIDVKVETDDAEFPIARLHITNTSGKEYGDEDEASYLAEFSLIEGEELTIRSRSFTFRRKEYNVFAIIKHAISTLSEEELRLNDKASPTNLARGLSGTL